MSTSEERQANETKIRERRKLQIATARHLMDKGLSKAAIAEKMGVSESTVRTLLAVPDELKE